MHNLPLILEKSYRRQISEGVTFGEKEINDILSRSNDFNVGVEYEMKFEPDVTMDDVITMLNKYGIAFDSVTTEHDDMIEIITGKMFLREALTHIKSMFSFIEQEDITVPEMAGMHISISTNKYELDDFNHVKFLLLMDSDYIHKVFPERDHVKNYNRYIEIMLSELPSQRLRSKKDVENIEWRIMTELEGSKYITAAVKDYFTSDGRIELRFIGGKDYHEMYDDIKIQLLRSLLLMEVAYTDLYDKVYYKELSSYLNQDIKLSGVRKEAYEIIKSGNSRDAYRFIEKNAKHFFKTGKLPKDLLDKLENVIIQNPRISVAYAKNILNADFPKGEDMIATDPISSLIYAVFRREPFEKGEAEMAKDGAVALQYARTIGEPFPEGEEAISEHPNRSYMYARHVLHGAFPLGEDAIATESDTALKYALYVINDRFPKGEAMIKNSDHWEAYKTMFIDKD